ncbi:hypothetical protein SBOR_1318 [Sclerotinia borealis F-4128]|uniref:DUF4470 domain-containing protein n=1 Tax=Sclerotinia borealis (strain F-4128) TaxID=1432307 RepID=W9CUZ8_SCLBF|nr:hypothetical protein SBOR_1318 [Sclerotinia borealis F-4128]
MHNISIVPTKETHIFYPIGNTPAVNLLEYHAPKSDKETTDILLLACGDPRSVLYSLFSEGKPGNEKFNFVCCDIDPAILARNILLFSLVVDNATSYDSQSSHDKTRIRAIWNLFYHFLISKEDAKLLRDQSEKLLSFSESTEMWIASPYSFVSFVSLQTLDEVRKIWERYAIQRSTKEQQRYEAPRRQEISNNCKTYFRDGGACVTYTAGVHWCAGANRSWDFIQGYWKTGVVAGNECDMKALGPGGKGVLNPTFMVSIVSEEFALAYTSDPLSGYHVPNVFDNPVSKKQVLEDLAASAKNDFAEWCKAFLNYATAGSIVANFYLGDAVTFSHELASRSQSRTTSVLTRLYTNPWSAKPLLLDGPGATNLPVSFEIIDTSNIVDYYGHLSILPATVPLLSRTSSSVLYTESLRISSHDLQDNLKAALLMDVNVASLCFGLTPFGNIIGYTTHNNFGEDMTQQSSPNRYRTRLPWRLPSLGDHLAFFPSGQTIKIKVDPDELCQLCFDIYLKMFSIENLKNRPTPGVQLLRSQIMNCYSRLSFVNVLHLIKRNVTTDWESFCTSLQSKIANDKVSHIGAKTVMETIMHLDTSGFMPGALAKVYGTASYSYVTMVVPRRDLDIFFQPDSASQPEIHITIFKPNANDENLFFSVDGFFGTLGPQTDPEICGEFIEDPHGWTGASDLIISCPVPAHILTGKKWHIGVCITVDLNGMDYMLELGPEAVVSSVSGKNKKRVTVSKVPPGIPKGRLQTPSSELAIEDLEIKDDTITISATELNESVALQATYHFSNGTEETKALQNAAFVTLSDITPCSMLLNIGEFSHRLIFPYPIDGAKAKTKIARKSLWIQVNVPVAPTLKPGGYDANPFPVITSQDHQPKIWALPRINLSTLPRVNSNNPNWIGRVNQQIFSGREKRGSRAEDTSTSEFSSALFQMKCTLNEFMSYMNLKKICGIMVKGATKDENIGDLLFISNRLRHSRDTNSLVFDGWVVSEKIGERFLRTGRSKLMAFYVTHAEHILWKKIMPAAVESCRRNWKHNASCEYRNAQAPLSIEPWVSPICRCGEGKDVGDFPDDAMAKPFREWATRIALPLLSAVSYVEAMNPPRVVIR